MNFLLTPNRPWKEFTFFYSLYFFFFIHQKKVNEKSRDERKFFYNVLHGVIYETNWFTTFCTVVVKYWNGTQTVNVLECPFQCIVTKTAFTSQIFFMEWKLYRKNFHFHSLMKTKCMRMSSWKCWKLFTLQSDGDAIFLVKWI